MQQAPQDRLAEAESINHRCRHGAVKAEEGGDGDCILNLERNRYKDFTLYSVNARYDALLSGLLGGDMIAAFKFVSRNIISIALLALGIVVGGYMIGAANSVRDFFFPESAAYVRSPQTIVNSINGIGQLVTVTSEVAKTDVKVEIHQGILNAGYYSANHFAIGAIEAGIDFDGIDEDSIQYQDETYTLTLPVPVITSCRIEHIDQNQHSFTLLAADWDMVRQLAQAEALMQFAEEMIELGILEKAEEEAELRLGDFVRELTGKPARILFAERVGDPELPDSCQPYTPSGWMKDANGAWKRDG